MADEKPNRWGLGTERLDAAGGWLLAAVALQLGLSVFLALTWVNVWLLRQCLALVF